ncbi:alpha/beta fold hydrolase [Paeniglutamicibacter psychrophenolicus]|uniref:alpha/beta fold hydrolase n=1 Tax=Paeniglutamicibacter psychrophenolicus TaxID=257454 RepID=UPI0027854484|nr:alpha/beta fold hydrolase [Paeniglutamicibacter psychrophenolicus]MDQ0093479.1 pimeloyl-ACP methyl ester carboxylesterase/predicted glycosyltransferase [Paeniglutamicibacter psychrophenolicus]
MATTRATVAPSLSGAVDRDGVQIHYAVYGEGAPTLLLMPTWSVVHSRIWKAQLGYLARHFRVLTFDGRGNGRSGRPQGPAAYRDQEFVDDAVAVLDATATAQAVVVGLSWGVTWSLQLAAAHPGRVSGIVGIASSSNVKVPRTVRRATDWEGPTATTRAWGKYNRRYWLGGGYDDFIAFFFSQMFSEAHCTKQIEDAAGWAHETTAAVIADATAGMHGYGGIESVPIERACARVRCPVLLVHGTDDRISPPSVGQRLADLTGGSLVLLEGTGHGPPARQPVKVNHLISDFAERFGPVPPVSPRWTAAHRRPRRVLYLSSPIGLGHARRDLAIADALRKHHPDVEISWLAQPPVTGVLRAAGELVHPASGWLASEVAHIDHEAGEHDLHAFQAIRRMDEILVHNFMVFDDVVRDGTFDLVVGDEAWDIDHHLHENPELKRFAFAWMTDFVGWIPMPDGGAAEVALTADYNAEMIEQRERFHRVRDRSIFVGSPEDVVPMSFGPGLPGIREWTEANFDFAGYVTGFDPADVADRGRLRAELGYREDRPLCVVTVGGSGVGAPLLRRILDAVPLARRAVADLQVLLVTGPRIDPAALPRRRGVSVRGMVPELYRHLAAADLAVVQGGLTTCMELTASSRPFIYVPLRHHFEQNFHVRHRLERYGAGQCMEYEQVCDPDALAAAMAAGLGRTVHYRPVETDGAARAAALLAELI